MSSNIKKITKNSTRKRFSDDQIKSLETTFESESRPELHLKQNLANNLGLQPRQVAIWFQNKRARSKSKQIEREYSMLKSNYDSLALQFEALRKENQALVIQAQKLRKMADHSKNDVGNDNKNQIKIDISSHELCMPDYLEEADVLNMAQIAEGSLASPENVCSLESCTFLDNTGGGAEWWEF
ncbi:homeobox 7 [Perilla frutescens var. frutescens]|nr:homeobox 7 [Perilla frutescens var. frutescens]